MKYFILFLILTFPLYAQLSPGDLSKAHAKFEGLSNCTQCHVIGEKVTVAKCLDCHKEIRELVNTGKGYHASSEVKGKNCWSCHSEHHGRNFRIVNFNKDKFDHNKTGFQLTGQHAKEECTSCHKPALIKNADLKKKKNTYQGLDTKCISCHTDFHQTTLGNECSSCHNNEKFRPALSFNHDKAAFKLTGSHTKVECIKCHVKEKKNGKDYQRFKGMAFVSCGNCHKDIHQGKFGADCKSCHVTSSFKEINRSAFHHDKTNFPLVGKHKGVQCQDCHKTDLNSKPKHEKCIDCHKDYHKGDFKTGNEIKDCKVCHTENGFTPSGFSIDEHNKSQFKLTGSHLAVPCRNCHFKQEEWHFRKIGEKCIDCHKNVHENEIIEKFMPGNDCMKCHNTESWNTISFEHKNTEFELTGIHAKAKCNQCHKRNDQFLFASLKANCEYCHKDIHFGQFKVGEISECQRCHTSNNWKPDNFDHNKTRFSLEGAHSKLKCSSCHKQVEKEGIKYVLFKLGDFRCAACHS